MSGTHLEFLVEDTSTEAALRVIVPRIAPALSFDIHPYQGKRDLLAKLPDRLRGYSSWLPNNWRIIVLVDCDEEDCRQVKSRLEKIARKRV